MGYFKLKFPDSYEYKNRRIRRVHFKNGVSEEVFIDSDTFTKDFFQTRFQCEILPCDEKGNLLNNKSQKQTKEVTNNTKKKGNPNGQTKKRNYKKRVG